ncbi:Zn-ribbon domain-containing OB-fold protein [Streptomyces sp. NPDC050256]|uniref:Zn-ribbon domain-containing OB-fold protein n=1 Tax=Streptomyces sp. NPDC050256 TaxID=3365607 RepID=UPI0037A9B260
MPHKRIPVVAGWFTEDGTEEDFRLLGTRCPHCSSVFFPPQKGLCRNPGCPGGELAEVPLSRRGTVWSYTDGRYRPPAPYLSDPEVPWKPYTLVAVELAAERMVVLGQAAPGVGVEDLAVGMTVEAVPGVMDSGPGDDDGVVRTTWHWRPVAAGSVDGAA